MTWTLLHDRMAFMADLIHTAETDPQAALAELAEAGRASEVSRLFGDEEGLLLSLRQRWLTMLAAKLDQAEYEGVPPAQARADLEIAQPGLHALLDIGSRRSLRVHSLARGEQRVVDLFGAFEGSVSHRQTVA